MNKNKGLLITIEGCDGCGKGTQSKKLKQYYENKNQKVVLYEFPRYDLFFGKIIARYLKGEFGSIDQVPKELICLAYASDRNQVQSEIRSYLEQGYIVICDRYTHSNLFSAAKLPEDQWNEFIEWVEEMEFNQYNIIKPDLTFYLYVDINTMINRIESRGKRDYQDGKEDIHENNKDLLVNAARCYLQYGENNPSNEWININQIKNGEQMPPDEVFDMIKQHIDKL